MQTGAVGQPDVDIGRGVVKASTGGRRKSLSEPAHRRVVGKRDVDPAQPRPRIDIDVGRPIDEHVGYCRVDEQVLQRTGTGYVAGQRVDQRQHCGISEQPALAADGSRDVGRSDAAATGGQLGPNSLEEVVVDRHRLAPVAPTSARSRS